MARDGTVLRTLDSAQAEALDRLCELIVPGSTRVGPVLYIDALLAQMPPQTQNAVRGSITSLGEVARDGADARSGHRGLLQRFRRAGRAGERGLG
jgi:hypothetical protein